MSKWNSILPKCCLKWKSSVLAAQPPLPRPHPGSWEGGQGGRPHRALPRGDWPQRGGCSEKKGTPGLLLLSAGHPGCRQLGLRGKPRWL